jgi:MFS family permease
VTRTAALEPLQHQPFRWLLGARSVAFFGNAMATVAVAFAVLDLTGSPAALGLVLAARSIPNVVLLLAGGVVADRWPRRRVVIVAAVASGLSQGLAAALVLSGAATVGLLAAIEAVNGAAAAFIFPAAAGLTPLTVPARLLQQANALLRIGLNGGMILGAAAGGAVVAVAGPGWGLAIDAAAFGLTAVLLVPLRVGGTRAGSEPTGVWRELADGWHEVAGRTWLWVVVLAFMVVNAGYASTMGVVGPVVADETIGRAAWGTVLAAQSVGLVVGGVVALRIAMRRPLVIGLATVLLATPFFVVLALEPALLPLVVLAALAGAGIEVFGVGWDVALQENVPTDRLSRVYSFDMVGSLIAVPIGQIVVGPATAAFGASTVVLGVAAVSAACLLAALAVPSVRRLGRVPVSSPHPAAVPETPISTGT